MAQFVSPSSHLWTLLPGDQFGENIQTKHSIKRIYQNISASTTMYKMGEILRDMSRPIPTKTEKNGAESQCVGRGATHSPCCTTMRLEFGSHRPHKSQDDGMNTSPCWWRKETGESLQAFWSVSLTKTASSRVSKTTMESNEGRCPNVNFWFPHTNRNEQAYGVQNKLVWGRI